MAMHYVYILESLTVPGHFYIGSTENLRERVRKHHADVSAHTAKYRPWKLKTYIVLDTKAKASRVQRPRRALQNLTLITQQKKVITSPFSRLYFSIL